MSNDDNLERITRYVKKISNSELDREKRFRAVDQLREFIRRREKNEEKEAHYEMMISNFDEIMSILAKSLREYSRRITSEIIDLIVDLIKSCILHLKDNPRFGIFLLNVKLKL